MSLSRTCTWAYLSGALTGAFGAVAVLAGRRGRPLATVLAVGASLAAGTVAVALEERAQQTGRERDR